MATCRCSIPRPCFTGQWTALPVVDAPFLSGPNLRPLPLPAGCWWSQRNSIGGSPHPWRWRRPALPVQKAAIFLGFHPSILTSWPSPWRGHTNWSPTITDCKTLRGRQVSWSTPWRRPAPVRCGLGSGDAWVAARNIQWSRITNLLDAETVQNAAIVGATRK